MNEKDIIEKVLFLKSKIKYSNFNYYRNQESDDLTDIWNIQKTGKSFLNHINLNQYSALISKAEQNKNVAGHIEINHNDDTNIFIEISPEIANRSAALKATLAHEISHKHLAINNVRLKDTLQNERLTDINTVLLGFGNIMVEGCEYIKDVKQKKDGDVITTTTTTVKIGYLSKEEFIFVKAIFDNITPYKYTVYQYESYLMDLRINKIKKNILPYLENSNKSFLDKNIRFINKFHNSIYEFKKNNDLPFKTIKEIKLRYIYDDIKSNYMKLLFKFFVKKISSIIFSSKVLLLGTVDKRIYRKIIRCPICKNKYQNFPYDQKLIKITCTNASCNYSFFISTLPIKD